MSAHRLTYVGDLTLTDTCAASIAIKTRKEKYYQTRNLLHLDIHNKYVGNS